MKAPSKLTTLKKKEKELQSEISQILKDLKTETGELMANLLEYTGLLELDHKTIAGFVLEMKIMLEGNKQKLEHFQTQGAKLLKSIKTKHSRKSLGQKIYE